MSTSSAIDRAFWTLETTVMRTALESAAETQKILREANGGELSAIQCVQNNNELLYFFLHLVNRFAFSSGGSDARDLIQGRLARQTLEDLARATYTPADSERSSNHFVRVAKTRAEFDPWIEQVVAEECENLDAAEVEYGACTKIIRDRGSLDMDHVAAKLAANVVAIIHPPQLEFDDVMLMGHIELAALGVLAESNLRGVVDECVTRVLEQSPKP